MRYCYCDAEVCSSSASIVYVIRFCIVFSKAALRKRGSIEPMEPPLDPPLLFCGKTTGFIFHDIKFNIESTQLTHTSTVTQLPFSIYTGQLDCC